MKRRILELWGCFPIPRKLRHWMVYSMVPKYPVGVVAVIPDEAGRFLMFKHTYRGRYPWGLPSGWLEPGEQPDFAAAREVREETGLQVANVQPLLVYSAEDTRRIDLIFTAALIGGEFRPSAEVIDMRWFGKGDLPEMMPSQYDMMDRIVKRMG